MTSDDKSLKSSASVAIDFAISVSSRSVALEDRALEVVLVNQLTPRLDVARVE